jgi:hypothetical protein
MKKIQQNMNIKSIKQHEAVSGSAVMLNSIQL